MLLSAPLLREIILNYFLTLVILGEDLGNGSKHDNYTQESCKLINVKKMEYKYEQVS